MPRPELEAMQLDRLIKGFRKSVFGMEDCVRQDILSRYVLNKKILGELEEMKEKISLEER